MKTDFEVTLKINGQPITVDLSKVDDSWLTHCLTYGVRRFINDSHSGLKGQTKYEACQMLNKDMMSGNPMPEKVRKSGGGSSLDPVTALAYKNAKAALTMIFKQATDATKAIDFAKHEKIAPFFTVTEDRAVWKDDTVKAWIEKQKADGKVDYMGDAKATLEGAEFQWLILLSDQGLGGE